MMLFQKATGGAEIELASLTACRAATTGIASPSVPRKIETICSSVNLNFTILAA